MEQPPSSDACIDPKGIGRSRREGSEGGALPPPHQRGVGESQRPRMGGKQKEESTPIRGRWLKATDLEWGGNQFLAKKRSSLKPGFLGKRLPEIYTGNG